MARTSKTASMLDNSGGNGHPCLFPDLGGNAFSLSPFRMMFAVGLSNMAFTMLSYRFLLWLFPRVFITNGYWILSKNFSASITLRFVNLVYHVDWFAYIEEFLHPWEKSHLVVVYDPSNVLLDFICLYFVENFYVCVHQWYWSIICFFSFLIYLSGFGIRMMATS